MGSDPHDDGITPDLAREGPPAPAAPRRPERLTDELAGRILERVARDVPLATACRELGLGRETLRTWRIGWRAGEIVGPPGFFEVLQRLARGRGRPPAAASEAIRAEILRRLDQGNFLSTTARAVGLTPRWLYEGRRRFREAQEAGTAADLEHADFWADVDQAVACFEADLVSAISGIERSDRVPAGADWRALLAVLERRFPRRWARSKRFDPPPPPLPPRPLGQLTDGELVAYEGLLDEHERRVAAARPR